MGLCCSKYYGKKLGYQLETITGELLDYSSRQAVMLVPKIDLKKSEIFLTQKINFKNIYYSGQIRIASSLEWSSFFDRKETMKFPSDFIEKYKDLLGAEAEEFFTSFDQEAVSAYRINPLKKQQKDYPDPIPGTPWAITVKFQENLLTTRLV